MKNNKNFNIFIHFKKILFFHTIKNCDCKENLALYLSYFTYILKSFLWSYTFHLIIYPLIIDFRKYIKIQNIFFENKFDLDHFFNLFYKYIIVI